MTGVGLVLALGASVDDVWTRLLGGASGIGALRRFDVTGHPCTTAAEVEGIDLFGHLRIPKNRKFMNRGTQYAVRAAKDALAASQIDLRRVDPYRLAVHVGSGQTGLECSDFFPALAVAADGGDEVDYARLGGRSSRLFDRYFSLRTLSNAGAALIAAELDTHGPSSNFVQGDAASAWAIDAAWHDLVEGRCDVAVAGGYDSLVTTLTYLVYEKAGLLSTAAPADAYRPFDACRDGLVLGEGAGFLVMERDEDARRREAPIRGEIVRVGCGMETEDSRQPKTSLVTLRETVAVATAGRPVDLVLAHGIGTRDGDRREADLLRACFGLGCPITALKGQTGYLGAATAAVDTILALVSVQDGRMPPIARLCDPAFDLDFVRRPRRFESTQPRALCLAWSWAGHVSAVAVRRWSSDDEQEQDEREQDHIDGD